MVGIYLIQNTITHTSYIGQSIQIKKRFTRHIWELNNNTHNNSYLQRAWNKYGSDNFVFSVLEQCPKEKLNDEETYWCNVFKPNVYNLGATGNAHTMSDETRQKLSDLLKGKKKSAETIIRMKEAQSKINHHRKHTPEAIEKIRKSLFGRPVSPKFIEASRKSRPIVADKLRGKKRPKNVIEKYIAPKRKAVLQFDLEGNFIKEWVSTQEATRQLNIPNSNIIYAIQGKRNQAGGFVWKYK